MRSSYSSPNLNVICGECRCSLLRACFAAPSQTTSLLKQWRRQSRPGRPLPRPSVQILLDSILAEQRDDLVTGLVAQGWVSVWARMDAVRVAVGQALARRGGLGGVLSVNGSSCYILGIRGATLRVLRSTGSENGFGYENRFSGSTANSTNERKGELASSIRSSSVHGTEEPNKWRHRRALRAGRSQ